MEILSHFEMTITETELQREWPCETGFLLIHRLLSGRALACPYGWQGFHSWLSHQVSIRNA